MVSGQSSRRGRRKDGRTHAEDGLHLGEVRPGVCAREHLDDEAAEGPDVGFGRVRGLLDDFGRHPVDGALKRGPMHLGAGEQVCSSSSQRAHRATRIGSKRTVLDLLRDAKVGDLDPALVVDEDVGALDVAVDDLALVEVFEPGEDLAHELGHERLLERAVVAQERGDGPAGHVLEKNVEVRQVRGRVEVLHDVCGGWV